MFVSPVNIIEIRNDLSMIPLWSSDYFSSISREKNNRSNMYLMQVKPMVTQDNLMVLRIRKMALREIGKKCYISKEG